MLESFPLFSKVSSTGVYELKTGITFNNISIDIVSKLKEIDYLEIFLEWEKRCKSFYLKNSK